MNAGSTGVSHESDHRAARHGTFVVLSSTVAQAEPAGIRLDHYHCYRVSPARASGSSSATRRSIRRRAVVREQMLCAPVEKNNQPIRNKEDHLVCYVVQGGRNAGKKSKSSTSSARPYCRLAAR